MFRRIKFNSKTVENPHASQKVGNVFVFRNRELRHNLKSAGNSQPELVNKRDGDA